MKMKRKRGNSNQIRYQIYNIHVQKWLAVIVKIHLRWNLRSCFGQCAVLNNPASS